MMSTRRPLAGLAIAALAVLLAAVAAWFAIDALRGPDASPPATADRERAPAALATPAETPRAPVDADAASADAIDVPAPSETAPIDAGCDVTVALVPDAGARELDGAGYLSCTDSRGREIDEQRVDARTWTLRAPAAGTYRLRAFEPGFETAFSNFDVTAGVRALRVELALRAPAPGLTRSVLVRWQTDDGAPFVPALAQAWTAGTRGLLMLRGPKGGGTATSMPRPKDGFRMADAVGRTRPGAPRDSFALASASAASETLLDLCLDARVIARVRIAPHEDEVVVRTALSDVLGLLGGVRGCVVGPDRVPILDALVSIDSTNPIPRPASLDGNTGCFLIDGIVDTPIRLSVLGGGASVSRDVVIQPGAVVDLGEIRMPAGCPVRARFVDASGTPLENARTLCASRAEWNGARIRHFGRGTNAKDARVALTTVAADEAFLVVESKEFGLASFALPECGRRDDEFEVRLVPGIEVALDLGLGSEDRSVRLARADGAPLADHTASETGLATVELGPGDYVARRGTSAVATPFRVEREPVVVVLR